MGAELREHCPVCTGTTGRTSGLGHGAPRLSTTKIPAFSRGNSLENPPIRGLTRPDAGAGAQLHAEGVWRPPLCHSPELKSGEL